MNNYPSERVKNLFALALSLGFWACSHSEKPAISENGSLSTSQSNRWTDLGTLVTDEPLKLSLTETRVYAVGGSTLYYRNIENSENWLEIETFDDEIAGIYTVSGSPDTIILSLENGFENLPLRISHDSGKSFQEYGSEFTDQPDKIGAEYEVPKQFFLEESGKLYASLSGLKTAVSTDLGRTWAYVLGAEARADCVGGESRTITLPSHPDVIFKTADCPLESTNVASIRTSAPEEKLEKLIDESFLGEKTPNSLSASAALPDTLFVGVEDGIVRYDIKAKKSEWLIGAKDSLEWNGYFTQVWVNPEDSRHIVVSGSPKDSELEFLLFESRDNGKNFTSLRSPNDPEGSAESSSGIAFGNKLVIAAKEEENNPRVWLFDLKGN